MKRQRWRIPISNIADSLDEGIKAHIEGRLDEAATRYQQILADTPDHAEALHFLGIALHQQGNSTEGLALLQRSVELAPNAAWFNDYGNVLSQCNAPELAAEAFIASLECDQQDPHVWNNLGAVLQQLNRLDDAAEAYRGAIRIDPAFAPALHHLGEVFAAQGQMEEAAQYYCQAYVLPPLEDKPQEMLAIAHYNLGNIDHAAEAYRQWLAAEPDNPKAQHLYAACLGGHGPSRASDAYVEKTFDAYAERFDNQLRGELAYRGPEMIAHALSATGLSAAGVNTPAPSSKQLKVLDGGCGTGLCAEILAPFAGHLSGVDLSSKMLGMAKKRGHYHALEKSELTAHLEKNPETYDLIVMADTLIYFGDASHLFAAASKSLRPGGLLVFTHEQIPQTSPATDYQINPSGRYSHAGQHIATLLETHGLHIRHQHADTLRTEFAKPVPGMVTVASLKAA